LDLRGKYLWEAGENCTMRNFSTPNIIKVIKSMRLRWVGNVAFIGGIANAYKTLVGKEERPLGRRRRRWEDDIIQ
jgi:hypothetical protein